MMFIRASSGKISLISKVYLPGCIEYTGDVPGDFEAYPDKYLFVQVSQNYQFLPTPGWAKPASIFEMPAVAAFLIEASVSATRTLVCNMPVLTGANSFVLDVTVKDQGRPDRIVQLVCTNQSTIQTPSGAVPEFDYLVAAIRSNASLKTLTTQMLALRNSEGRFNYEKDSSF
jgi:hypothetical protein